MSHFRAENLRFQSVIFTLPTEKPFEPHIGKIIQISQTAIPEDIPFPLLDAFTDEFSTKPEEVVQLFVKSNPSLSDPRSLGRVLFHTEGLSPYAISYILFNSQFSSRALLFSFITAIDLDFLSFTEAFAYITQKVALPMNSLSLTTFASTFAAAFHSRNPVEWPDPSIVQTLFFATIVYLWNGANSEFYSSLSKQFPGLTNVSKYLVNSIGNELKKNPPGLFFTSLPARVDPDQELTGEIEHEGRYMSSWKAFWYIKTENNIECREIKHKDNIYSNCSLDLVTAQQRFDISKKPYALTFKRLDNQEFGYKLKNGERKKSPRTSYTIAFKSENELMQWISSINYKSASEVISYLN